MAPLAGSQFELREESQTSLVSVNEGHTTTTRPEPRPLSWLKVALMALGLLITSVISLLLLIAATTRWTLPENLYDIVVQDRASVQLVVQVISNAFALIWVTIICMLINCTSRVYFRSHPVTINTIRLWHSLCSRSMQWDLPVELMLLVLVFIVVTAIPSAIWAGALTPVGTTIQEPGYISLPGYQDTSNIKEYPSEIDKTGPSLRSALGYFTYSVGVQMQGSLLASASSATPVDGSVRQHQKMDYTGYNYYGRSYGVGASVGLFNSTVLEQPLYMSYSFTEIGYDTSVTCIRNSTSDFALVPELDNYWAAAGELPNSEAGEPEYSVYPGHGTKAIVAIGVGRNWRSPQRMLAIAAGDYYKNLDKMQCSFDFQPAMFNISVGVGERNITVTPLRRLEHNAFEPGNLTHILTRQFELIANDQTNLYVSLVGNSLNASIADYMTAQNSSVGLESATPIGLSNAFQAMADDMLVTYASAQLMIADQSYLKKVTVTKAAVRVGEDIYIRAVFGVDVLIILLVVAEVTRTKLWRQMLAFDYMDPGDLILRANRERKYHGASLARRMKISAADTFGHANLNS